MTTTLPPASVLHTFGVRPVINASGIYTDLGGSLMSPEIMAAWAELNLDWLRMTELLDAAGVMIAGLLDVPAARVTPSASSAIALAVAACMTGEVGALWEQLPDTQGLRSEVLFQAGHLEQYKYAICARLPGATLRAVAPTELATAIDARTAGIFHVAHLDGHDGTLSLENVSAIARTHGVPVVVDAAYLNFPLVPDLGDPALATAAYDTMRGFHLRGADLVCFSAKYFWGPNAGGFVMGREDLVRAVAGLDFTRFESGRWKPFGRAFKMGRFEVAATALALRAWLSLDHRARLEGYRAQVERFAGALAGVPGVEVQPVYFTLDERWVSPSDARGAVNAATVHFESAGALNAVAAQLEAMNPRILPFVESGLMTVVMETVRPPDELTIAAAIRSSLGGAAT